MIAFTGNSFASAITTGTIESSKSSEKYSLKNLSSLVRKTSSFTLLKSSLEFKGFATINSGAGNATYLKYNKGNISYVIPYRYKMVLTKFKTPSPTN